MSEHYIFVDTNDDTVKKENTYKKTEFTNSAPNTSRQKSVHSASASEPTRRQEDISKLKWILIAVTVAFLINLVLASVGLWLAVQGTSSVSQVRVETDDELNSGFEALQSNVGRQVEQINIRIDKLQDVLLNRQNNLNGSMDVSFTDLRQKSDLFSKIFGFLIYHQTNLTDVLDLMRAEDLLSQVTDILIQHQANLTGNMTATFSGSQHKMDSFSKVFRYLVNHKTNLAETLEEMRTGDLLYRIIKIRLVNGNSMSGRVEIFNDGEWGTICDDVRDLDAGNLMCRMLGFKSVTAMHCDARYGEGNGKIWLDELTCSGTETTFRDCGHNGWGIHDCDHNEDLSITCQ